MLSDTWINLHMSIIPLFTILPPWPLWLLEPAHPSLPYWIPPPRSCGCSGNISVQLAWWVCFSLTLLLYNQGVQWYSEAQHSFFLPPCGFCATINLISSDLARECFPCNLATTGRCEALTSMCQEPDFPSVAPGANNRMQRDHQHQISAVRRCIFKPWK